MSGSRTANQELVYCHACQNEFYKDRENLSCPECRSDFTEVIDPTFDPREEQEERNPLHEHSAWERDPDEMDIDDIPRGADVRPNPGWQNPPIPPQNQYIREDPFRSGFPTHVFEDFSSMVNGMTGNNSRPGYPPGFPPGHPPGYMRGQPGFTPPPENLTLPPFGNRRPRSEEWLRQDGPQVHTRTFNGGRGGIHISVSTGNGWRATSTSRGEFSDIGDIFQALFQTGPPGSNRGMPQEHPINPFAALFSSILNPANAQHGDAVFSQEAFDRVMSQLMEQHASGNAPGPASEAAIAALPRKKISEDMLDEDTHQAECTICMDNVSVGEEVTVLPCHHWFHHPCVEAWLKEHDTCPICRSGIAPKEGDPNTPRTPQQAPLHNEDPFLLARQQSGSRQNPFIVPESPTQERRRPNTRRYSSEQRSSRRRSDNDGSSGITGRVRSFFGVGGGNNNNSGDSGDNSRR